ncbi:precorrin-6y C5,15-methyltransferase (decarboxylating) subunit CbiE [Oricola cellulosilytica]|uniref:Precorrin-6y C5,15-methyltransferase (Decarboxylating) subunit CbiE n=1 Tax=Oricola cellulosilytica TaxID=1429082 RepID=A0A4R0PE30_9HYPH|nr:precorrin-6y C5,15-methyltransferase (decarboxylating) subunit CbiE [Oricola cellulosilytica]TCD15013.1 precorrin-6y C5,15-methyltransferase (decarboxylating) subunit CbiE [Oricola cellulosilytica]
MTTPWLHIVGIGEDGMDGLTAEARRLVEDAEVIVGGSRHHELSGNVTAERIAWPSPFDAMIETIKAQKGRRIVVLVTGDPLWYSVGARILKAIPAKEIVFHPQVSAFQLAACRLGWSLPDVETLTVHGRAAEQIVPWIAPGARLLVLTKDGTSPGTIAGLLRERGYGASRMTVLAAMGGKDEARFEGIAEGWSLDVPDFHLLAVECVAGPDAEILPRTGLPDGAFTHDGKMTKRAARALALAKLVPLRDAVLWDLGCGCGSIAIEWMRAAPETLAIGIEPQAKRRAMAEENARKLGAPKLQLVDGTAPEALDCLPTPDAVFIGGGVSQVTIGACMKAMKPHGRLVAHAVTLESETVLLQAFKEHGGELQRISVETAEPVGPFHGWRPSMPVTQWAWTKSS